MAAAAILKTENLHKFVNQWTNFYEIWWQRGFSEAKASPILKFSCVMKSKMAADAILEIQNVQ